MSSVLPGSKWVRHGTILTPELDWETGEGEHIGWIQEPSMIHDDDGYHIWYSSGYTDHPLGIGVGYATATSPFGPWTKHGTGPVNPNVIRSSVIKYDGTFYMIAAAVPNIAIFSSADGIAWSAGTVVLTPGSAGAWDEQLTNSALFLDDDGTWYIYYESGVGSSGVASAAAIDGPYTKYASNPIIVKSHPCVLRFGDLYVMYCHGAAAGEVGDNVIRAVGTTPFAFTIDQNPVFPRVGEDEGEDVAEAQVADVRVFVDGDTWLMTYTATPHASVNIGVSHTKVAYMPFGDAIPADYVRSRPCVETVGAVSRYYPGGSETWEDHPVIGPCAAYQQENTPNNYFVYPGPSS